VFIGLDPHHLIDECLECGDEPTGPPDYHFVWQLDGDYKCVRCRAGAFRKDGTPSTKPDWKLIKMAQEAFHEDR